MPVSHDLRCVFVHIPKTGGTSVEKALGIFYLSDSENLTGMFGNIQTPALADKGLRSRVLQHLTMGELQELLPPAGRDYFSFAFVRNPWDRLLSSYCKKDPEMVVQAREQGIELHGLSFELFVEATAAVSHIHLLPQYEFLFSGDGRCLVDSIGRFETLAEDFAKVCTHLGVRRDLPHDNPSRHSHYRAYYTPSTRDQIALRYRVDIERFGYEF